MTDQQIAEHDRKRDFLFVGCEAGHDWQSIGGCNAYCHDACGCSVPVHKCARCGDCDYGQNGEADQVRANCAALHGAPELRFHTATMENM